LQDEKYDGNKCEQPSKVQRKRSEALKVCLH